MAIQIELAPLGHVEKGDPNTIWHEVAHTTSHPKTWLAYCLEYLWCPRQPKDADGPAISIRFT